MLHARRLPACAAQCSWESPRSASCAPSSASASSSSKHTRDTQPRTQNQPTKSRCHALWQCVHFARTGCTGLCLSRRQLRLMSPSTVLQLSRSPSRQGQSPPPSQSWPPPRRWCLPWSEDSPPTSRRRGAQSLWCLGCTAEMSWPHAAPLLELRSKTQSAVFPTINHVRDLLIYGFSRFKVPSINCMALKKSARYAAPHDATPKIWCFGNHNGAHAKTPATNCVRIWKSSLDFCSARSTSAANALKHIVAAFTSPPILANECGDCPEELLVDVALLAIASTSAFCLESINRRGDNLRNRRNVIWPHQQPRAPPPWNVRSNPFSQTCSLFVLSCVHARDLPAITSARLPPGCSCCPLAAACGRHLWDCSLVYSCANSSRRPMQLKSKSCPRARTCTWTKITLLLLLLSRIHQCSLQQTCRWCLPSTNDVFTNTQTHTLSASVGRSRHSWNDNDNDNDTLREVPHQSNEGLASQARVSGPWPLKKKSVLLRKLAHWQGVQVQTVMDRV